MDTHKPHIGLFIFICRYVCPHIHILIHVEGMLHNCAIRSSGHQQSHGIWASGRVKSPASRLVLNILFRLAKELYLCIACPLWGNPRVRGGVPSQMSDDGESVSIFTVHVWFNQYFKKFSNDVEYDAAFCLKSSIPRHDWWKSINLRPSTARYRHFIGQEQTNHGRDLVSDKKG